MKGKDWFVFGLIFALAGFSIAWTWAAEHFGPKGMVLGGVLGCAWLSGVAFLMARIKRAKDKPTQAWQP